MTKKKATSFQRTGVHGLVLRGKIYYIRKWIDGDLYFLSLNTSDFQLATELFKYFLKEKMEAKIRNAKPCMVSRKRKKQQNQSSIMEDTEKEIENEKETEIEKENFKPHIPKKHNPKFEKEYKEFLEVKKLEVGKRQIGIYKQVLNHILETGLPPFTQKNINEIIKYYQKEKNYRNDSINKFVNAIKAFLNYLIKQGKFSRDNYEKLNFIKFQGKIRDTIITEADLEKIRQAIKPDTDFSLFIDAHYEFANRPAETTILKVKDIDFEKKEIKIYMPKVKKTKTLPIPDTLFIRLAKKCKGKNLNDYIFDFAENEGKYSRIFKNLKEKLKLNPEYTLYTFRHTRITELARKTNVDLKILKSYGGWSDLEMLKFYDNRNTDDIRHKVYGKTEN
jgi:integrase